MIILETNNLIVRNLTSEDANDLTSLVNCFNNDELLAVIDKAKDDDFDSEGKKMFAIEKMNVLIGLLEVNFDKPYIYFSYNFTSKEDKRVNAQELLTTLIKYFHNLYKHREIITYIDKFDFQKRSLLENLSFRRKSFDKETNIYTYSLFSFNPNK